ncbi:YggS family pyridoxal phosphate-dependent enzyme [Scytonema sp. UIC 10036]|uniref:YggS family pyridoxal phosphate-dependent enzyme n=1 Tax=Scytonema sp. UIC 10036 TaxID=2304196 RepID=UPI0012DAA96F|nr:YggS family pyridoxal phosphate-dependent enzyme [Scytonema sp. UIC 10036]MUH00599.1 YggS family pyridoxal phosphate-dependent enzyme [Scytonema sp. UIC 10036]
MSNFLESSSLITRIQDIYTALPPRVCLIAVSKQVPVTLIRQAYALGIRNFGESRIQEAQAKQAQLLDLPDIIWHFIGRLQSNKVKAALQQFSWIHSVDSLKLAQQLDQIARQLGKKPNICLQVKFLEDPNKSGWSVSNLLTSLQELNDFQHLQIRGLMTIPPAGLTPQKTLEVFQKNQYLAKQIQEQNWSRIQMQELSMGMSEDYSLALEAEATMIRLGRILFGNREAFPKEN